MNCQCHSCKGTNNAFYLIAAPPTERSSSILTNVYPFACSHSIISGIAFRVLQRPLYMACSKIMEPGPTLLFTASAISCLLSFFESGSRFHFIAILTVFIRYRRRETSYLQYGGLQYIGPL